MIVTSHYALDEQVSIEFSTIASTDSNACLPSLVSSNNNNNNNHDTTEPWTTLVWDVQQFTGRIVIQKKHVQQNQTIPRLQQQSAVEPTLPLPSNIHDSTMTNSDLSVEKSSTLASRIDSENDTIVHESPHLNSDNEAANYSHDALQSISPAVPLSVGDAHSVEVMPCIPEGATVSNTDVAPTPMNAVINDAATTTSSTTNTASPQPLVSIPETTEVTANDASPTTTSVVVNDTAIQSTVDSASFQSPPSILKTQPTTSSPALWNANNTPFTFNAGVNNTTTAGLPDTIETSINENNANNNDDTSNSDKKSKTMKKRKSGWDRLAHRLSYLSQKHDASVSHVLSKYQNRESPRSKRRSKRHSNMSNDSSKDYWTSSDDEGGFNNSPSVEEIAFTDDEDDAINAALQHFSTDEVRVQNASDDDDKGAVTTLDSPPIAPPLSNASTPKISSNIKKGIRRPTILYNSLPFVASNSTHDNPTHVDDDESMHMCGGGGIRKGSHWAKLLAVTSMRNHMPNKIRDRRNALRSSLYHAAETDATVSDDNNNTAVKRHSRLFSPPLASITTPTSSLHACCASPFVTLSEFQDCLERHPVDIKRCDEGGRYPLHIIGDNDALLDSTPGRQTATAIAIHLMQQYPEALTQCDNNGHFPFVSLIVDWVYWVYESHKKSKRKNDTPIVVTGRLLERMTGDRITMMGYTSPLRSAKHNDAGPTVEVDEQSRSTTTGTPVINDWIGYSSRTFPRVELWEEAEWCFSMLSWAMDELGGKNGGLHKIRQRSLIHPTIKDRTAREDLAHHVVTVIPTLLKTVLLLEEDGEVTRKRLLRMSIFRRIFVCPESVGPWLSSMLRRRGLPSKCAVDYLHMLSQSTAEHMMGNYRTILSVDLQAFYKERERVFEKIENLEGIVASLVTLDTKEVERAASTAVVWHLMGKSLGRPFVVALVMIDFVLHITLMLAFRNDVQLKRNSDLSAVGTLNRKC
jgi:hypothetical protein